VTRAAGVAGAPVGAALAATLLMAGCADLYRWPDRMSQPQKRPAAAARKPEPAPEGFYVVKPGDTLYSIAFRNQLDFRELAVWNDVGPDYLINVGQVLRLTVPEIVATSPASTSIQTQPMERPAAVAPPARAPGVAPPPPAAPVIPGVTTQWRWPTKGTVAKGFGDGGKGIDIAGALGQPVFAAAPGKVVYSGGALKGYGELIIIKHDDLHLSAYGYNRRRLVGEGAMVAAGQPIAELGVGPEQKPVLHFEIRKKGKPVDPADYLPR
jgi:lipoprotein NlpD